MSDFHTACEQLEQARAQKAIAERALLDAENAVLKFIDSKPEGSVTHTDDEYKVVATYGFNRTIDQDALPMVHQLVGSEIFNRVFPVVSKLSLSDLRYFQLNEPEIYRALAQAVTTKPAKTNVKLEVLPRLQEVA